MRRLHVRRLRSFSGTLVPYWRIVRLLPGVSRSLTVAVVVGVVVGAVLPVAFAIATGVLVGSIPDTVQYGLESPSGDLTLRALGAAGVLFVVLRIVDPLRVALAAALGRRLDLQLQQRAMAAVSRPASIAHLEDPATLDAIARARGLASWDWPAGSTVAPIANVATQWLRVFGSAMVLATFSWWLAVLLCIAWVAASSVFRREFLRITSALSNQVAALRRADYLRDLVLTPGAAKEIRLWGLVDWLIGALETAWLRVMTPVWRERGASTRNNATAILGMGAVQCLAFATVGWAAARGQIDLAALAVFITAINGVDLLAGISNEALQLAYGTAAVPAVTELERRAADDVTYPASGVGVDAGLPRQGIRLEGVSFRYPGRHADVLSGFDLAIPAGGSLAIVGENGAGKTTLVKLLARLYEADAGQITVDGVDLRAVDARAWQRRIAAVFQDFVQYKLSAADNVALGAPDYARRLTPAALQQALVRAALKAGILEAVEALPQGWDTILSCEFTGGTDLSGGQWQRLALARALFAVEAGASVLILDEPTANLDVRAEAALYERFLDLTRGLTTILISHRFSTVRRADVICVLERGRVLELGTHASLLAASGRYAEMFTLRAARFVDDEPDAPPEPDDPVEVARVS